MIILLRNGILDMTPEKIRKLHDTMFKGENKFAILNIDNAGKYSGCVSFDGETFTPARLDKVMDFAKRHGMQAKINTFLFYADFPIMYEAFLKKQYTTSDMNEEEKVAVIRPYIRQTLFNYVEKVCERYGDDIVAVDILNEVIYDPDMIEDNFRGTEADNYHQREGQWLKYLNIDDLVSMALMARKKLPNTRFVYNDMNWVNPQKRKEIIRFVQKVQQKENECRRDGRLSDDERGLIDSIGFEAHLDTGIDIDELDRALEDVEKNVGLPIEVTELDIARVGENFLLEEKKQKDILARIQKLANQERDGRPRISAITMWSQSDELCFMDVKCGRKVYGSVLDSNFEEKEFEQEKEKESVDLEEYQDFNYHTHTSLCGHASGEMRDYVEMAIQAGFKTVGFSDHNPPAIGKENSSVSMDLQQFEVEYLPTLKKIKEEYKDKIDVKIGLEVEYYGDEGEEFPPIKEYRKKIEPQLDYMILGQHFAIARDENGKMINPPRQSSQTSSRYPLDYAQSVVEAIKTGKFAYVAHPDIFMKNRDDVPDESRAEYEENCVKATEMICKTAAKYKIPLEVNLGAISAARAGIPGKGMTKDGKYEYPVPDFWRVAEKQGCDVLIGVDAHDPDALIDRSNEKIARKVLLDEGIRLNYMKSFIPLGIGSETNRLSSGKKMLIQMSDCSENIRDGEIQEATGKIIRNEKDLRENLPGIEVDEN